MITKIKTDSYENGGGGGIPLEVPLVVSFLDFHPLKFPLRF